MVRFPLVFAVAVLLASCSAPSPDSAEPLPEESTFPTSTPAPDETPVAESPYVPCDDADRDALTFLYVGEYQAAPTGSYPDFLPLPSCLLEEPDKGTAIILDATQAYFDELEATVTATQGAGVPTDGQGVALDGAEWTGQTVSGMYFLDVGFGVDVPHIAIGFKR